MQGSPFSPWSCCLWHVQVAVLPLLPLLLTTLLLMFSSPVLAFLLTVFTIVYDKKKGGLLNASAGKHAGGVEGHWSVLGGSGVDDDIVMLLLSVLLV